MRENIYERGCEGGDLVPGVIGGEGDAQARGTRRDGGGANRGNEEAARREVGCGVEGSLVAAEDDGNDGVFPRKGEAGAGQLGAYVDEVGGETFAPQIAFGGAGES